MRHALAALVIMCAAALGGCGKPVLRIADPSLGDYYTEKEFKKLRQEQRDEYCNDLALQDSAYQEEIREARDALQAIRLRCDPLRQEADSLALAAAALERRVAEARSAKPRRGGTTGDGARWTVRAGDSLWRIAADNKTYGDGRKWPRLYAANKDRIGSPDRIYPGQEITIPR
ncbi:MAG TPA: LysM peptidoglycan-binding domain-containing protein [Candidatus Eisenbacteria bacterium]|nr:LysM peptidoglycan-binding domain-containing protein [Candidatus Eisenbacteria bacterium]